MIFVVSRHRRRLEWCGESRFHSCRGGTHRSYRPVIDRTVISSIASSSSIDHCHHRYCQSITAIIASSIDRIVNRSHRQSIVSSIDRIVNNQSIVSLIINRSYRYSSIGRIVNRLHRQSITSSIDRIAIHQSLASLIDHIDRIDNH